MKRDMDLARALLIALEESEDIDGLQMLQVDGLSEKTISYHVKLLHEAGLIEAVDASGMNELKWYPVRLTWEGHEFLDTARDDTRWNKTKKLVLEKSGSLSFEAMKFALIEGVRRTLS